jgi:adenine-specific DNA-methyltransferase
MILNALKPRKALNKAFLKLKPIRPEIDSFKANLIKLLDSSNDTESEEFHKNLVSEFLKDTYYKQRHFINTKGRNDLVIHNGMDAKSTVGVIIEAKKPTNKAEMLTSARINTKAFQELLLYYMRERFTHNNLEVKHLIATNIYEWFIFDATLFDRLFAQNKHFVKQFSDFEGGRMADNRTDFFYKQIAEPFIDGITTEIEFAYFSLHDYQEPLRNANKADDNKLISLFKLLSPEHLLKQPFINDSNSLDKGFYSELLHIVGLTETKQGGKKLIERKKEGERNSGSMLEDAIIQLDSLDKISRLEKSEHFGNNVQEKLFNVALELSITWINRILFLKLLEAQLITYQNGDKTYAFLKIDKIKSYDDLNTLFFQVLAKKFEDRNPDVSHFFEKVPYLNSSLFEPTELEQVMLMISNLGNDKSIPIHAHSVLKDRLGKKRSGNLTTLEYLFAFLDAYDFSGEGSEEIQEESKNLINASVLGLIFEKINGYKDGSFFTPGFITMYMCRETIRRAVVQKFNETKAWKCNNLDELYDKIEDRNEANQIVNSLKICDPAVGSGHFLVSSLNEIIAIKSDLRILQDRSGRRLKEYHVEVVNDELAVTDEDGHLFEYKPGSHESQRVQETLFHEKQTIIENCLFGVDINPNSVKICRLRLWIELLKNAYYKTPTELETLPNIDINIKCGNSLISRFAIDADLSQALRKSKWSIESYRIAVATYRNAQNKEVKREMERLINQIKMSFSNEISLNDPIKKRLDKLSNKLYHRFTGSFLFEPEPEYVEPDEKEKELDKKRKKEQLLLESEIEKLTQEYEDKKNNRIFDNAFEWRFEFPDVLNEKGEFIGFDVVIGNPPYGVTLTEQEKHFLKTRFTATSGELEIYTFFIELVVTDLLKKCGAFSFITTNTIFYLDKFSQIRKNSFLTNHIISLLELEKQVFADAPDIVPAIFVLQRNVSNKNVIKLYKSKETKRVYDLVDFEGFEVNEIEQKKFETKAGFIFNLSTNEEKESLISKLSQLAPIKNLFKVVYGIKTGDNERFISKEKTGSQNWKKCASSAKNIRRFTIEWQGDYLNVCDDLAGLNNINYEQPKILIQYIRKLSMPIRLVCAFDQQGEYYPLNNFSFIISEKDYSLKVLLGILNSRLMNWYFTNCFVDYNIKPKYIEQLPFPENAYSSELEAVITEIISLKIDDRNASTSALETQIDQLVYHLYGLTEEEIGIVEKG